ncbi:type I polyketide synthase [Corallococcus sp. Z5C101001]|uniref:type I polyketide synthase n=1 Tax=Corallococcus sp. Z5C101001 TaxID=2596829 RepID=UPI00117C3153|nr:type I polyketide synthase [Corallococcus sp. Z5C101001]TSC24498.1 type I polyketide synthase [Corallococcus sp. Z5C101001]
MNRSHRLSAMSSVKLAFAAEQLRPGLELLNATPIAIVGMGCRFPGEATTPEAFWRVLRDGVDTVTEVPRDRWDIDAWYSPDPDVPGRMHTRKGAFLSTRSEFDADFFGISPREAASLDPQQRLLLEVSWEALERAGMAPDQLAGSLTGVYVGLSTGDYAQLLDTRPPESFDAYAFSGTAHSMAAGRLSYHLGLQGPSVALDAACASSLVAVHLACQALRAGGCDLALAGGVNRLLSAQFHLNFSQGRMLAPDGRCKTFDAAADGYVRGEGAGIVVLKRLADALRDQDPIVAVIRGSAVNQDGRSSGLTVPNGPAQQAVIRQALQGAGVNPEQVDYVEAHGTGTSLGDPIELGALGAVFGPRPPEQPLLVGSVKTNIGHLEAAAGIAGLIKVALALQHGEIPAHLHLSQPNPHVPWDRIPIRIPTQHQPWPSTHGRRIAGISSFGFSGTNAHVLLESAPGTAPAPQEEEEQEPPLERPLHLLTLSARGAPALQQLAARFAGQLRAEPSLALADACFSANTGRAHLPHRLGAFAGTGEALAAQLEAFASGAPSALLTGQAPAEPPEVAFLFTGQGSQYPDMGRKLYESQPVFRESMEQCDALLRPLLERPLLDVLYHAPQAHPLLHQTAYTQPALFAIEYALAELWKSWGIVPGAVLGHSVGEYAAACVAGVFSLEDGLKLIAERGRLMQELPERGTMAAVSASPARVEQALGADRSACAIAALNGPESVVISGSERAVDAVVARLTAQGIRSARLQVSHAFHSPLMEPMLPAFERVLRTVTLSPPSLELISNVGGGVATAEVATAGYWCRHVRQPVRFAEGVQALVQRGFRVFVELGPKPTLSSLGRLCAPDADLLWLASLRQGRHDWQTLLESLGSLYVRGAPVDWAGFDQGYARHKRVLPTYPFQRKSFWFEATGDARVRAPSSRDEGRPAGHTPLTSLLESGDVRGLAEHLRRGGALTGAALETLPQVAEALVREHQRQRSEAEMASTLYRVSWSPTPPGQVLTTARNTGEWLILADRGGLGRALATRLEARGEHCMLATAEDLLGPSSQEPGLAPSAVLARWLQGFGTPGRPPLAGIVYLWALDAPDPEGLDAATFDIAQRSTCDGVLWLLQELGKRTQAVQPPLWCVTRGVHAPGGEPGPRSVAQAPLWGLAGVASLEHPELRVRLIDVASDGTHDDVAAGLDAELRSPDDEDRLALRRGQRYAARLEPLPFEAPPPLVFNARASYLITGGLGGIGLAVAAWMVRQGARHLVLMGRSGSASSTAREAVESLELAGAQVLVFPGDVSRPEDVTGVLAALKARFPPLRGVVHAAAVLDDGTLRQQTPERFQRVRRPKADGAWNLHLATRHEALDFFVCFSSAAALLGAPGQSNYAAANAFLDALARYRRGLGLPGLSIGWGPWKDLGMAAGLDAHSRQRMADEGLGALETAQGLQALGALLSSREPDVAVLPIDWSAFASRARPRMPLLRRLRDGAPSGGAPAEDTGPSWRQRWGSTPATERPGFLHTYVRGQVARILRWEPEQPMDAQRGFAEMGMDSLMAVELRNRLQKDLGQPLSAALIFNYPRIEALAQHLQDVLLSAESPPESPSAPVGAGPEDPRGGEAPTLSPEELIARIARKYQTHG